MKLCFTHGRPLIPHHWYEMQVGLGDYADEGVVPVDSLSSFWAAARPFALGTAGTHAALPLIRSDSLGPQVSMTTYRKAILSTQCGRPSDNFGGMRLLTAHEAERVDPAGLEPNPGSGGFLIAYPLLMRGGVGRHYAEFHHLTDLLRYLAIAVENGVLRPNEVSALLESEVFIPGACEVGVYPRRWLASTLSMMEAVGREFLIRYGGSLLSRDAYQRRAVGFLAERLGSYLLLKEMSLRHGVAPPAAAVGWMVTIVELGKNYEANQ